MWRLSGTTCAPWTRSSSTSATSTASATVSGRESFSLKRMRSNPTEKFLSKTEFFHNGNCFPLSTLLCFFYTDIFLRYMVIKVFVCISTFENALLKNSNCNRTSVYKDDRAVQFDFWVSGLKKSKIKQFIVDPLCELVLNCKSRRRKSFLTSQNDSLPLFCLMLLLRAVIEITLSQNINERYVVRTYIRFYKLSHVLLTRSNHAILFIIGVVI